VPVISALFPAYNGPALSRTRRRSSPAKRAAMALKAASAGRLELFDPTTAQLTRLFLVSASTFQRARNPRAQIITDAAIDRLIARAGIERVMAALDRASATPRVVAAE
jgi:hypothetical protein